MKIIKEKITLIIKFILFYSGFYAILRNVFPRRECAILRYHSIQDKDKNFYASPSITISPAAFEKQVHYLSKHYTIISMDDVVQCLQKKKPFPKNSVVFTFDDGYADNYIAYKILKKYNATGTFYISSGCINNGSILWLCEVHYLIQNTSEKNLFLNVNDSKKTISLNSAQDKTKAIREIMSLIKSNTVETRENIRNQIREQLPTENFGNLFENVMLTENQISEITKSGMIVGGHTLTHANLPNATPQEAKEEVMRSKELLEKITSDSPVVHFSYPNGGGTYQYYNNQIKKLVKGLGFASSTTSRNRLTTLKDDIFEIPRIGATENLFELIFLMDGDRFI